MDLTVCPEMDKKSGIVSLILRVFRRKPRKIGEKTVPGVNLFFAAPVG
jgi:hypothetical protein